jgi:hypothetical protein
MFELNQSHSGGRNRREDIEQIIFKSQSIEPAFCPAAQDLIKRISFVNGPGQLAYLGLADSDAVVWSSNVRNILGDDIRGPSGLHRYVGKGSLLLYKHQEQVALRLMREAIHANPCQGYLYERPVSIRQKNGEIALCRHRTYMILVNKEVFLFNFIENLGKLLSEKTPVMVIPTFSRGLAYGDILIELKKEVMKQTGSVLFDEYIRDLFSRRKLQVLGLASEFSQLQIGKELGIGKDAVRNHAREARYISELHLGPKFDYLKDIGSYFEHFFLLGPNNI